MPNLPKHSSSLDRRKCIFEGATAVEEVAVELIVAALTAGGVTGAVEVAAVAIAVIRVVETESWQQEQEQTLTDCLLRARQYMFSTLNFHNSLYNVLFTFYGIWSVRTLFIKISKGPKGKLV